jgi:anaerobic selenocysteine-containing dehydrogenase
MNAKVCRRLFRWKTAPVACTTRAALHGQRATACWPNLQIVAGIAEATLGAHTAVTWQAWSNDYALVRDAIAQTPARGADDLRLFTLRSDSQFNTTIYSHDDRFRGIRGSRMVLLMNERDICRCRIMRSRARCRR